SLLPFLGVERGVNMCKISRAVRLLWLVAILAGGEAAGAALTAALLPGKVVGAPASGPAAVQSSLFGPALPRARSERTRRARRQHAREVVRVKPRPARAAVEQPRPVSPPRATASLYERTTAPLVLREQGCRAGRQRTSGLVVLDFGRPAFRRHTYGTVT